MKRNDTTIEKKETVKLWQKYFIQYTQERKCNFDWIAHVLLCFVPFTSIMLLSSYVPNVEYMNFKEFSNLINHSSINKTKMENKRLMTNDTA